MTSRRRETSNERRNYVMFFSVEIYNIEQHRVNLVNFSVNINNFRQRRNNVVIFNVEFHKVDQSQNNVVNMTICKKSKRASKYFELQKQESNETKYVEL